MLRGETAIRIRRSESLLAQPNPAVQTAGFFANKKRTTLIGT